MDHIGRKNTLKKGVKTSEIDAENSYLLIGRKK